MNKIRRTRSLMSACWKILQQDKEMLIFLCIGLAVAYLIVLALVQSALQAIFQAAVYLYARNGQVPDGFREEFLSEAMVRR